MWALYKKLLDESPDIRILVFSGDDDAVCATAGTLLIHSASAISCPCKKCTSYSCDDATVYATAGALTRTHATVGNGSRTTVCAPTCAVP